MSVQQPTAALSAGLRISKGAYPMKHRIRRTLALVLCIVMMSVSSVALAAPSKTFTQKPTLKAITQSVKSKHKKLLYF